MQNRSEVYVRKDVHNRITRDDTNNKENCAQETKREKGRGNDKWMNKAKERREKERLFH